MSWCSIDLPGTEKRDAWLARFTNSSINNSKDFEIFIGRNDRLALVRKMIYRSNLARILKF